MHTRRIDRGSEPLYVLVFERDEEVVHELLAWANARQLGGASFTGIGAFQSATLGYFDVLERRYLHIVLHEQVEVLSLAGNIAHADDGLKVHAHVVLGKRDGTAHGGHLLEAHVRPTLELTVLETPVELRRRMDPATGLTLL